MHNLGTTTLKRDALGRTGGPRGQREALLDEFERRGVKGAAFTRTVWIRDPIFWQGNAVAAARGAASYLNGRLAEAVPLPDEVQSSKPFGSGASKGSLNRG